MLRSGLYIKGGLNTEQTRKGLTTAEQLEEMKRELAEASKPEYVAKQKKKRILRLAGNVLFGLIIFSLLFLLYQIVSVKRTGNAPNILGFYLFAIETDSMSPTLPAGSVIVSRRPPNPLELEFGDIVTFINFSGQRVTHRIVQVSKDVEGNVRYRTKGDNPVNGIDKDILTPDRIEAVFVFRIPMF